LTTHPEQATRIIFPARGTVELQRYALPPLEDGQVLVRSLYSLMSIGTETTILHQRYDSDTHFARMFSFPQLQTGVQTLGFVEATAGDSEFARGQKLYLRMGHGSHHVMDSRDCSAVPENIDEKQACWAGLAKTAYRAAWAAGFSEAVNVFIIGAGPVGQMLVRWASALGCAEIACADISATRLRHAEQGGASVCLCGDIEELLPTIRQLNEGKGPTLVIDSTGNAAVFKSALAAAAPFGKIILLGDTGFPGRQCLTSDVMTKGLTVQATHDSHDRDGWTERKIDALFFDKLQAGSFPLGDLISHEFSPAQCTAAYDLAERERQQVMGILFDWTRME